MRAADDLFQELCSVDESHGIEAKRGTAVDRSVMETVCAFSNEPGLGGGYLLLGVERDEASLFGNMYRVPGVDNPDKVQSDLISQCATLFNQAVRPRVSVERLQGKTVVAVQVPEAAPTDKPIYFSNRGLPRGAYRRVGPSDVECTDDDLIPLYAGHQQESFDATVLPDVDMEDIDPNAVTTYRDLRRKIDPEAAELDFADAALLRSIGCAKKVDGEIKPNVAGLLLFGTKMALRRCFPMMRIDYIRLPGREWVADPERRFDTLEIREPLFVAIRRATNTVQDELVSSFSLPEGSLTRQDEPTLPSQVIREAIVNAVMHRSYRIHGAIQILRYANRLEIHNPGHSIKADDQLGEEGSEARNPKIAAVLHEIKLAETKGSGIQAMRKLMEKQNLMPPTFESSRQPDKFTARFLFHHLLNPADVEWLHRLTPEALSDEEARALIFVREVGAIDNTAYRNINSTDLRSASTHLRRLRELGLLEMKGSGVKTHYRPTSKFWDGSGTGQDSHHHDVDSHQVGTDSHHPAPDSHHLPESLRQRIPAHGRKPRREVMQALIVDLCRWRPLSARELSTLLNGRGQKVLVRDYLGPMVRDGTLTYTIPEMENHPDQKYTAPAHKEGLQA